MEDEWPLVSVILTCYNKARWIREAAEGILTQTLNQIELILIDDASIDGSVDIVRDIASQDKRVRAVYHEHNQGITRTWKEAVKLARGVYIARCDGDDLWTSPTKLERQIETLDKANGASDWCNTDFDMVDQEGHLVYKNCFASGVIPLADTFEKMLATRGFTNASTWLVKAELMKEASEFMNEEAADDTFELQLFMFLKTKLVTVPDSLVQYRFSQQSDSRPLPEKQAIRSRRLMESQLAYLGVAPSEKINWLYLAKCFVEEQEHQYEIIISREETIRSEMQRAGHLADAFNSTKADVVDLQRQLDETKKELTKVYSSKRWKAASKIAALFGK